MAQMTGTNIVALARVYAQDTSAANPAVTDADALLLLNDVLLRYEGDVESKQMLMSAAVTGLTFSANQAVALTTISGTYTFDSILDAYPSDTSAVPTLLPNGLTLWTVEQMLDAYNNDGSGTVAGSGTREWQAYAWEREATNVQTTGSEHLRVYVWPALATTRYLTLRVPKFTILPQITDTPDLSQRESRIVARLLAWEMARLHTQDDQFLQQILMPIPNGVLDRYFEAGKTHGWMQSGIRETGAMDA